MSNFDEFDPGLIEEQIERFSQMDAGQSSEAGVVHALRDFYARDAAILEHVWQRLEQRQADRAALQIVTIEAKQREKHFFMEDSSNVQQIPLTARGKKRSGLTIWGSLVAAIIVLALVGSSLFVLNALHQGRQTPTGTQPNTQQPLLPTPSSRSSASGLYVVDNGLYRLDPASGKKLWFFDIKAQPEVGPSMQVPRLKAYAMATGNGTVYIGFTGINEQQKTVNILYAIDATNGHKLWSLPFDVGGLYFANGTLYASLNSGAVQALNPNTGATLWSISPTSAFSQIIAVTQGKVYGISNNTAGPARLFALDANKGKVLWSQDTSGYQPSPYSTSLANGVFYVSAPSARPGQEPESAPNYVLAYSAVDGHLLWKSPAVSGLIMDAATEANGMVYFGAGNHQVYALDAKTGQLVWQRDAGGNVQTRTAVEGDTLIVAAATGEGSARIIAYNARNGSVLWSTPEIQIGAGFYAVSANGIGSLDVVVSPTTVYYGSLDATIHLLDIKTGAPTGQFNLGSQATQANPTLVLTR